MVVIKETHVTNNIEAHITPSPAAVETCINDTPLCWGKRTIALFK